MATLRYCLAFGLLMVGRYGYADDPAADTPATAVQQSDDAEWMPKFVLLINELPTVAPSSKGKPPTYRDPSPGDNFPAEPFAPQASFAPSAERKEASDANSVTIHVPVYETQYREVERDGRTVKVPIMVARMVPMKVPEGAPLPVTIECDDVSIQATTTDEGDAGYTFAIKGRLRMRLVSGATLQATNATFRDGVLSLEDVEMTSADAEISFAAGDIKLDVRQLRLSRPVEAPTPAGLTPVRDDAFAPSFSTSDNSFKPIPSY
ncbi:hypothetical protein [Maioricimonas sp. JC845]|uniref:hypothetical protein n=1 Tax=Maioricimonas sp. JC845 TaxID=3232138 RepID=UPI003459495A